MTRPKSKELTTVVGIRVPISQIKKYKDKIRIYVDKLIRGEEETLLENMKISAQNDWKTHVVFLMDFFQKNASVLHSQIDDSEREQFRKIVKMMNGDGSNE